MTFPCNVVASLAAANHEAGQDAETRAKLTPYLNLIPFQVTLQSRNQGYVEYLLWQLLFYVDFPFQTCSTECSINEDQIGGAKLKVVSEELKDL